MPKVRNLVVIIALAAASVPALAVEGFFGRSIPGIWVMPRCGVIGPHPGFSFTLLPVGYSGSISGTQEIPIAGTLAANVSANVSANYLAPQYVYKTNIRKLNFSSAIMFPVSWVGVTATVQLGDFAHSVHEANAGRGDIIMLPLT